MVSDFTPKDTIVLESLLIQGEQSGAGVDLLQQFLPFLAKDVCWVLLHTF